MGCLSVCLCVSQHLCASCDLSVALFLFVLSYSGLFVFFLFYLIILINVLDACLYSVMREREGVEWVDGDLRGIGRGKTITRI